MKVKGVVTRVEEDFAWVDVSVAQGCGRCHEPGGCGGVNIARPFAAATQAVRVRNDIRALPGESVGVLIDDGVPLKAALSVYGWPIVGVLAGAAVGVWMASPGSVDLLATVGAAAGGTVAALLGRRSAQWVQGAELSMRLERELPSSGACHS